MQFNKVATLLTAFSTSFHLPKYSESPTPNKISDVCLQALREETYSAMNISCSFEAYGNMTEQCGSECYNVVSTALDLLLTECEDSPFVLENLAPLAMGAEANCYEVDGRTCAAIMSNITYSGPYGHIDQESATKDFVNVTNTLKTCVMTMLEIFLKRYWSA